MTDILNFPSNKGWKLLEQKSINDRTIVVWYNPQEAVISLIIFHLTDQPNEFSKQSPYSTWGWATYYTSQMYTEKEAAEVVSLFLQDMESDNYWWEKIN
jgi:hypothetical protein